jgi:hypothetical protein
MRIELVFEKNTSTSQGFHVGETFTLLKIAYSDEWKKYMYLLEEGHLC